MDRPTRAWIDGVLDGAACWGAELDTQYRVLALTVEPTAERHPDGDVEDRRLLLVLHPCSDFRAQLVHGEDTVERFGLEQLVLVVDRMDGAPLRAPVLDVTPTPLPRPLSLEGAAGPAVLDGRTHTAEVTLVAGERRLTLHVSYDEAELRRPDGSTLSPQLS